MILNDRGILNKEEWLNKGYSMPTYNREDVKAATKEAPFWIHFGVGNIFRAFQANVIENLLNCGEINKGLIVAEGYDYEIIQKMSKPQDDLGIVVTLKADNTVEKRVVGSVVESLVLDIEKTEHFNRLKEIFTNPSLQMASFTITEKGYNLAYGGGILGNVTALMYERFKAGQLPMALVSMDNCSHNGERLKESVLELAKCMVTSNEAEEEFLAYLSCKEKVSYPLTMIDKITPRPHDKVKEILKQDGIEDIEPILTSKNTYVAPFVNAEECEYLVIEDWFPNGREALEKGGLYFTDRETVEKVEKMKVCTCLNPLHTALAIYGCLLGYESISAEMKQPYLKKLVEILGYNEGLKVVVDPLILSPKEFIDQVITMRISNPFMPDTPQRIATDTSQKLAIRFGETIKAYRASDKLKVENLKMIPLVLAGWVRYLMGVDDNGQTFELSPDPLLEELQPFVAKLELGNNTDTHKKLYPILSQEKIFGVDLYEVGLGETVENYYEELNVGTSAVENVLKKYICS